jgi:nucleoside-diphosphate-sugar epimerase
VLNITAAQKELEWTPQVPMIEGLKKTALWMRKKLDDSLLSA